MGGDYLDHQITLSVIFLCHNNQYINLAIEAVLEQIDINDEIIVVDDHSNSSTLCMLEKYKSNLNINIIASDRIANRAYNRNLGARHAQNLILVFMDGDMVMGNESIVALKNAHSSRSEKAFIGQKHGIHFDELQMKLFSSLPNYIDMVSTYEGRSILEKNPLFIDSRRKYFEDPATEDYRWTYYYTGLCSVEKDIFFQVGGFDENFFEWGSEDIDLGYRLSKLTKIGFLTNLHGFHIPHARDLVSNERSNIKNIQYMMSKYKSWEFEIKQSFYGYGDLILFKKIINQMRLLSVSEERPKIEENELIIDIISQENYNGKIFYKSANGVCKVNSFFGTAIPFCNRKFITAYISDHIFIYPTIITSRILQEALRVAKRVLIYPTTDSIRIAWNQLYPLTPNPPKQHFKYEVNDLLCFSFFPTFNEYIEVVYIKDLEKRALPFE